MLEPYICYETGIPDVDEFPPSDEPVWILGQAYSSKYDLQELQNDVRSRLWMTYRKGFVPIGGEGPSSDKGWGCMLRCGQMVFAEAMSRIHLGRKWKWTKECTDPKYLKIVNMFADRKDAVYSIHQIALMGMMEGKEVGQWFGPNTVAQVFRKLCHYDAWTDLVVYIAMDNTLVIEDIKTRCAQPPVIGQKESLANGVASKQWRPLLIFVPLRLGLSEVNPIYIEAVKACLKFKQSLGIIGGRPNHALYFIGFTGDDLIYLDPHFTQQSVSLDNKNGAAGVEADQTYHCMRSNHMNALGLDPSVAMCFLCQTEEELDQLCTQFKTYLVDSRKRPLFEVTKYRPSHWGPLQPSPSVLEGATAQDYDFVERQFDDSDEEFELL